MKAKKIPMRMCIGCKEMKPKKELLRIVKKQDGSIVADLTGKVSVRGAYICKDINCFDACLKTKALHKAFEVQIPQAVYDALKEDFENLDCAK